MIDKNVAGVVLVPALSPPTPPFHVRQLQHHGIPVVFCHRPVKDCVAPLITWDQQEVGHIAGQALLDQGHRRIAYFARYRYLNTEHQESGLRKILEDNGSELPESRVFYGTGLDDTPEERALKSQALKAMFNADQPVTAIFCHDDDEAELIHHLAMELGIRVPGDCSIMGFGSSQDRSGVFRSRLTSIAVNEFDVGARAARVLHEMRSDQRPLDSDAVIYNPLTLFEGDTVAAPAK